MVVSSDLVNPFGHNVHSSTQALLFFSCVLFTLNRHMFDSFDWFYTDTHSSSLNQNFVNSH